MSSECASAADDQPKHRACDECRFRKIACSKEPGGCARCFKEGLQCNYSPQKPMGRPRKRRLVELEDLQASIDTESSTAAVVVDVDGLDAGFQAIEHPALPLGDGFEHVDLQPDASERPPFDLFDWNGDSSMSFIDLLPNFCPESPDIFNQTDPSLSFISPISQPSFGDSSSLCSSPMHGSDRLGSINFNCRGHIDALPPPTACSSSLQCAASYRSCSSALAGSSPCGNHSQNCCQSQCHDSPERPSTIATTSTPQSMTESSKASLGIPCTCLSSLFFALNSLSQLPSHIPSAIRVVRHASKMAYQVINCPECYDIEIIDPSKQPHIQCFQNLMCLGSLVPSACSAYMSILRMVNVETERAKKENRKLWFSFEEIGGTWTGNLGGTNNQGDFLQMFNNKYIPPDVWRTAIRRILRVDVHGLEGADETWKPATPSSQSEDDYGTQPLKGVIALFDAKNRKRHAQIDHLIITGQMPEDSPYLRFPGGHKVVPPEARNCNRILETARLALSNLSIA